MRIDCSIESAPFEARASRGCKERWHCTSAPQRRIVAREYRLLQEPGRIGRTELADLVIDLQRLVRHLVVLLLDAPQENGPRGVSVSDTLRTVLANRSPALPPVLTSAASITMPVA